MAAIYSYVLRFDDGAAPNPFWGICTLTICKPKIRKYAPLGSWVIGTGSKNSRCNDGKVRDFSHPLVYAMRVTAIRSMADYDTFCQKQHPYKIPDQTSRDWRRQLGDCLYDYSKGSPPTQRKGQHRAVDQDRDLSGENALISNHFYYFGEHPVPLPEDLYPLIKKSQGHKIVRNPALIARFEEWVSRQELNVVGSDPQLRFETEAKMQRQPTANGGCASSCSVPLDRPKSDLYGSHYHN